MPPEKFKQSQASLGNQHGGGLLIGLVVMALLAFVGVGLVRFTENQSVILEKNVDRDTLELQMDSAASRALALFSFPGDNCGQDGGICPALYPDPLNCGKIAIKQTVDSKSWSYSADGSVKEHFVASAAAPGIVRDVSGAPRVKTSLGSIFVPMMSEAKGEGEIATAMSKSGMTASLSEGAIETVVDGYTCGADGLVSEIFLNVQSPDRSKKSLDRQLVLPLPMPKPQCFVTTDRRIVNFGEPVTVTVATVGPWSSIQLPTASGPRSTTWTSNSNPVVRLDDNEIAWEGTIVPANPVECSQPLIISAAVRMGTKQDQCATNIVVKNPLCVPPPPPPAPPVPEPKPVPKASPKPTPATGPDKSSDKDKDVVEPKKVVVSAARLPPKKPTAATMKPPLPATSRCPDGYFAMSGGVQYKMIYAEVNGECLGIRARTK